MQSKLSACGGSRKRHLPRRRSAILSGAFFIRIGRIFLSNKIKMGYHTSMAAHLLMYVLFIPESVKFNASQPIKSQYFL
ncbi:MAG: hypothetical protein ACOCMZ_06210, partial [Acetivibrio ethanolgignens]